MKKIFTLFYVLLLIYSCENHESNENDEVLITNAKIYTLQWDNPDLDGNPAKNAPYKNGKWVFDANSILIRNGRILFVGDSLEANKLKSKYTKTIDAKGSYVIPGLIESHGHLHEFGEKAEAIKLQGLSGTQIIDLMVEKSRSIPKGEWIVASGWDEAEFANNYPDMLELSKKTPDHPIVLVGLRGFGVMGNALAFKKAGITNKSIPEKGGEILLDQEGNLKYILINGAKRLLTDKVPKKSLEQETRIMNYGFDKLLSLGFTTTHHLGVEKSHMEVYQSLHKSKKLPMRVHAFVAARKYNIELVNKWLELGPTNDDESFLQVRGFKGYYDGSLGSRGAQFLEDYSDKIGHRGVSGYEYGFDQEMIKKALNRGFQLAIHAIGDKANRDVLDLYENYFLENPDSKKLRHRIEHAQVVHPNDFDRFHELNITASMEPAHAVEDMPWAVRRMGMIRAKGAYAWRTLRKKNTHLIFNSDFTGSDPSFFYGMYCGITKRKLSDKKIYFPEQAMTREEVLRAYTIWASYAASQEDITGTIEKGKWADLTFLDVDILNANPEEILKGNVLKTMINGEIRYSSDSK